MPLSIIRPPPCDEDTSEAASEQADQDASPEEGAAIVGKEYDTIGFPLFFESEKHAGARLIAGYSDRKSEALRGDCLSSESEIPWLGPFKPPWERSESPSTSWDVNVDIGKDASFIDVQYDASVDIDAEGPVTRNPGGQSEHLGLFGIDRIEAPSWCSLSYHYCDTHG